jgi:hypothetical protein
MAMFMKKVVFWNWCRIVMVGTDVSEERIASIFQLLLSDFKQNSNEIETFTYINCN